MQKWLDRSRVIALPWPSHHRRAKTPTILQMEAVECGAASMAIILAYYGRRVPLAELRQACGVSRDGSTAANLVKAARFYGLKAKGFKKGLDALPQVRCPCIVFWNFNHFLVVEGWGRDRVYLNDPATGPRTISLREFDESYTGVVLVMEPAAGFQQGGRNPSILWALWQRLRGSTGAIAYCILAGFLLVLPGLAVPAFTQIFVDNVLVQGRFDWLRPLLIGLAITAVFRAWLNWLQLRYLRRLKIRLAVKMSSQFLWHILRLPISFYAQRFAGEVANRVSLNDKVADVLSGRLATTVIDVVMMGFYALVMLQYDGLLTGIAVIFVSCNLAVLQWVSRQRVDANIRMGQEYGKVAGVAIAGLQSIETLKSSALESDFFARWAGYYTKAINAQQELSTQNQILSTLPVLFSSLASVLVLIVGGYRVIDGHLSIGMLVAFQSLMSSFLEPANRLVNMGSVLQELEGDLSRLEDVLGNELDGQFQQQIEDWNDGAIEKWGDQANGKNDGKDSGDGKDYSDGSGKALVATMPVRHYPITRLHGHMELRNITFGYSPVSPPLIEDFNLMVAPGQRVALVGSSGSGKSTIAKLLTGLYRPWQGEVYFDGIPLPVISRSVLTSSIAIVEQDLMLFAGSVRDNLCLWDKTVRDRDLIRACEDAAIYDAILALPGGFDAELREGGANLSGGQRQRLEIARALVNNPAILIMDEATSSLDPESEQIIDQNLRRRGCTCIIVAHRLSTIRDSDEIIVFDQGKVVQRGTHTELFAQGGLYSHLVGIE